MSEIVDTSNTEFNEIMHMPIVALSGLTVFPGMKLHFDYYQEIILSDRKISYFILNFRLSNSLSISLRSLTIISA